MNWWLKTPREVLCGTDALYDIWRLMVRLDVENVLSLCTDSRFEEDSVYHHLGEALEATMRQLGIEDVDGAKDALGSGCSPHSVAQTYGRQSA